MSADTPPHHASHLADPAASTDDATAAPPQPQPVLDEAAVASKAAAVLAALAGVGVTFGIGTADQWNAAQQGLSAALTIVAVAVHYLLPLWRARRAATWVTPVASPVSATGEQLVTAGAAAAIVHAATANTPLPAGEATTILDQAGDPTIVAAGTLG